MAMMAPVSAVRSPVDKNVEPCGWFRSSLAAMTYRLHKLDLLSEWHYRKLYIEISSRGFRKSEPDGGPREISQVLQKVFRIYRFGAQALSVYTNVMQ